MSLLHTVLPFIVGSCLLGSPAALAAEKSSSMKSSQKLTIERITSSPALEGSSPRSVKFSPDGSRVTFLRPSAADYKVLDLWEYNLKDQEARLLVESTSITGGEEELSQVERARRERMRISNSGIVSYSWSEDGAKLLFPLGGDLYQYELEGGAVNRLTNSAEYETDSRFSPQGSYVSYILDHNIHVVDVKAGKDRVMTTSPTPTIKNGSAEFIAMEEMDRDTGYWWSEDEKSIAFIQFDEAPVEIGQRYEIDRTSFKVLEERYPRAGTNNVTVKLGIMTVATGDVTWVDLGDDQDIYLARVNWVPDNSGVFFQRLNRDQTTLDVIFADAATGKTRPVLTEKAKYWINLHDNLDFIKGGKEFLWTSERSGFSHLYHYKTDGTLIGQLTDGDWVVTGLKQVDETAGMVYFDGHADTPLERHLYRTSLTAHKVTEPQRITASGGSHGVKFPDEGTDYIDYYSDPSTPSQVSIRNQNGELLTWVDENKLDENHPYFPYLKDHITPEFGKFTGPSGDDLYYRMYKPANMEKGKKYPVIFSLYGGPHAQLVRRSWDKSLHQILAQSGYIVFTLDNRGSNYRGVEFEGALYHEMGKVEVEDQVAGAAFLKKFDFVDADRIGVHGHSYGGYMTLMTMFKAPEVFKVGVSGAPVTEWRLYDTNYTERYLGHPDKNKDGYDKSSVFPYAQNLKGKLLLVHGMADDNVLFNNSTMLLDELQKNAIQFDFMAYPGQTHRLGSDNMRQRHLMHLIKRYFDDHL
ncbi:S9 family peptidase [Paremcibacter congregatus]|uniref:S9 family peptidase n=1 Tax=Paremcibacter congregatus TaxID=2043170 RepID=UPI0030EBDE82